MPFDLSSVNRGYGEMVVSFSGQDITIRYRADVDSRAMVAMQRMLVGVPTFVSQQRFPDIDGILVEVERLVLGWDITRGGEPVPVTRDELLGLPPTLPMQILQAIVSDINDPNRRRPSSAGSPTTASSEPAPITTASSVTANGQESRPGPSPASLTVVGSGLAGEPGFGV